MMIPAITGDLSIRFRRAVQPDPTRDPDVWALFRDPQLFRDVLIAFCDKLAGVLPTHVMGIDSKGFIIGSALAVQMGVGFVPLRRGPKGNRMSGDLSQARARRNYEMRRHLFSVSRGPLLGSRVIIADDWLDSGSTAATGATLIQDCGGELVGLLNVIDSGAAVEWSKAPRYYGLAYAAGNGKRGSLV